jgi:hypothetical protein
MKWYPVCMFRFLRSTFFWILLALAGAGTYLFFYGNSFSKDELHAQIIDSSPKDIPSLHALLVQVDEVSENRRVLECNASGCIPKEPPKSVGGSPLSDGTNWYRYAEQVGKDNETTTVLEKIDNEGNVQTITEENPLVRPRAMMLSTDGSKIAYFLDNIHDAQNLTELWTYDSKEGGAKVIAEKLYRPDIASPVRWNASSRLVWFLQDNTTSKELIVAPLGGGAAGARFVGVNWSDYEKAAENGVMDINDNASLVALAEPTTPGFSKLVVVRGSEPSIQKSIKGNVVFVRWMENDGLLYAVQDGRNLSFWMANAQKEWPITRMSAVFESAHSAGSSGLAAFVASPREGERHLYVLQIETGLIKDETVIPGFSGKTHLVQTSEQRLGSSAVAGISSAISDGALVSFVEDQLRTMTHDGGAKPMRILVTDNPNTLFVDYIDSKAVDQRILVTVIDAMNPEWKVVATYKTINGIWKRSDTTGDTEPRAVRLYEWEESLSQWILKQTF